MAVLTARRMGVVAAAAVAVATWCAAAAGGAVGVGPFELPLPLLALILGAIVVATALKGSPPRLPPGKDVLVLTGVTVAGFVGLYLAGWTGRNHLVDIARLLPLAVAGLGLLWPQPNILRYCLLLGAGTLLGTVGGPVTSRAAVAAALAALAVGLIATNRLATASGPRLGGGAPARGRRVAGEAFAVLAIVGLLAALASSLLPPPPGEGGGQEGDRRAPLPQPAAPRLDAQDRLDVAAGRGAPGDEVVLLVGTRRPDVWRATTYDHWDGESWSRSPEAVTAVDDVVEPGIGDIEDAPRSGAAFQSVVVLARSARVLPAAARPTFVSAEDAPVRQGEDASLYPTTPLTRGDRYVVISDGSQRPGNVLRDTPASAVPADVADAYLQLPQVSARVRALAAELTGGGTTTYGKVRAVEGWIDEHTKITRDAKPVPDGTDPLDAFLLEQRSGPPERAASAMAVMLRAVGIPARLSVGFLPGTRTGRDRALLVRSRDAHAWVEAWFPTAGWQRFDPTGLAPDAHDEESSWDRLLRFLGRLLPLVVVLTLVAATWLAWRGTRWWRRQAARPWATRFFARVERAGAARGRPRRPQETPVEYAGELAAGVLPDLRLAEVGALVTVAAWSRHEPSAEDRARAEHVLREATKAAPARRLRRRTRPRSPQGPTIAKP
ncbi:MAG: transglutaminase TgpA family protein [Acidimicrobiales bacterium]